jgi:hypothetical protein
VACAIDAAVEAQMSSVAPIVSVMTSGTANAGVGIDAPRAAAQQSFQDALHRPVAELQIAPGDPVDQLGGKVMERIETFYDRVQHHSAPEPGAGAKTPASEQAGDGGAAQPAQKHAVGETHQALQMLEHAFSFAIEATLISKVSTESTRVFNTFLKGQ